MEISSTFTNFGCKILTRVSTPDAVGGEAVTWTVGSTILCGARRLTMKNRTRNEKLERDNTIRFYFNMPQAITNANRIRLDDIDYILSEPNNVMGMDDIIQVDGVEVI